MIEVPYHSEVLSLTYEKGDKLFGTPRNISMSLQSFAQLADLLYTGI